MGARRRPQRAALAVKKAVEDGPSDGEGKLHYFFLRSRAAATAMGSSSEFTFMVWKTKEKALNVRAGERRDERMI
jgi:hypothetical protein